MKKAKVSNKTAKAIHNILTENISLCNIKEFEEMERRELFEERPECWTETENTIYEYTERIRFNIEKQLSELLNIEL